MPGPRIRRIFSRIEPLMDVQVPSSARGLPPLKAEQKAKIEDFKNVSYLRMSLLV